MRKPLDTLAEHIGRGIDTLGIHLLQSEDLALIWGNDPELSDAEKRLRVENFGHEYGFDAYVKDDLSSAFFKKSK